MSVYTCGRCGALCGRNDRRCTQCGRWLPAVLGWRPWLDRLFPRDASLSRFLAMVLVLVYLALTLVAQFQGFTGHGFLGRLTAGVPTLIQFGAVDPPPMLHPIPYGDFVELVWIHHQWWRLVTANFLHVGVLHILFNAVALLQAGTFIEGLYGPARFLILFIVTGVTGMAATLLGDNPVAGASTSVCGLVAALFAYGKKRGGTHGQEVRIFAIQWALYALAFTLMIPGVSHLGHAGGALGGLLVAWTFDVYRFEQKGRESDGARLLAVALAGAVVVCIAFAIRFGIDFQGVLNASRGR